MEFQLSYLKSLKLLLWKCCTQYVSKFGKLSSGHRIGKGQFSFQSQRRAMAESWNYHTVVLISHASEAILKTFKLGFSGTWTENLQMYKLGLEKAEEHLLLLHWLQENFSLCDHNKLWKILKGTGIPDHPTCLLRNLYVGQEATVRTRHGRTDWFKIGKGVHQDCILSPWLFNLYAGVCMHAC